MLSKQVLLEHTRKLSTKAVAEMAMVTAAKESRKRRRKDDKSTTELEVFWQKWQKVFKENEMQLVLQ